MEQDFFDQHPDLAPKPRGPKKVPAGDFFDQHPDLAPTAPAKAIFGPAARSSPDPDLAAQANRLGREAGLAPELVERNLPEVRQQQRQAEFDALLKASPKSADWARDTRNIAVAQDDWRSLAGIAGKAKKAVEFVDGNFEAGMVGLSKNFYGVVSAAIQTPDPISAVVDAIAPESGRVRRRLLETVASPFNQAAAITEELADQKRVQTDNFVLDSVASGIESIPSTIIAAVMSGGASLAAGMSQKAAAVVGAGALGALTGGGSFLEGRKAGLEAGEAALYGLADAVVETGTELIPIGAALKDMLGGSSFAKTFMRQIVSEVPSEWVATLLQNMNQWAFLNPEKPFSDWFAEQPEALARTTIAALTTSGAMTAVSAAGQTFVDRRREVARQKSAEQTVEFLQSLVDDAGASVTRKRDLTVFERFLAAQVKGTSAQNMFIDAEVVRDLYQKAGIQPGSEQDNLFGFQADIQQQLEEAALTGGDIVLDLAGAISSMPDSGIWDQVKADVKLLPNAPSLRQAAGAQDFQAELDATLERNLTAAEDDMLRQAPSQAIFKFVEDRLAQSAATSRPADRRKIAALIVARYETRAARLGITVEEAFKRSGLEIETQGQPAIREAVAGGTIDSVIAEMQKEDGNARPLVPPEAPATATQDGGLRVSEAGASKAAQELREIVEASGLDPATATRSEIVEALSSFLAGRTLSQPAPGTVRVYHGTAVMPFEAFAAGGKAQWFAVDPALAAVYANSRRRRGTSGDRIIPMDITLGKVLDLGETERVEDAKAWVESLGLDASQIEAEPNATEQIVRSAAFADAARAAGYDTIRQLEGGRETYGALRPEQIKSPFADPAQMAPGIVALFQTASVRSGAESMAKFGLKAGIRYTTRQVAAALEMRQRRKYGDIKRGDYSKEAARRISKWMTEEVLFEQQRPDASGVGWYSTKFQAALDKFGDLFPELKRDAAPLVLPDGRRIEPQDARDLMTALVAITSDGQKVLPNFRQAADLYSNFRKTGTFSTSRGHQRQSSIDINVKNLQTLFDTLGAAGMRAELMQEKTISELKKIAKAQGVDFSTAYKANVRMPLAAVIFGPKLGAFYANLMGAEGYLTMDRWWSRTFNRYRGNLLTAPTKEGLERFRNLLSAGGSNSAGVMTDEELAAATIPYQKSYARKKFKNGTEIEKAANTIYKAAFESLEDQPFNASDRSFMLEVVELAQKSLARKGVDISVADIQAVLWYYEKRLYGELGARESGDVSYEEAANDVVAAGGRIAPEDVEDADAGTADEIGDEDFSPVEEGGKTLYQTATPPWPGFQPADYDATEDSFTAEEIEDLLRAGRWSVLTAENPNAQALSDEANADRNRLLLADLEELGAQVIPVIGHYGGNPENSFIVIGADEAAVQALGNKYGQQSVLSRRGLTYQDGSIEPAVSANAAPDATDLYSIIPSTGFKFQVEINFDPAAKIAPPSAPQQTSSAFATWFGESKIVDENGAPMVVYHGSDQAIEAFNGDVESKNNRGNIKGFFFTTSRQTADAYGPIIVAAYLKMERPFVVGKTDIPQAMLDEYRAQLAKTNRHLDLEGDAGWFDSKVEALRDRRQVSTTALNGSGAAYQAVVKAGGFDGIIDGHERAVFEPTQIKSVDNTGSFNPGDARILYQEARPVFNSALEVAVAESKTTRAPPSQWAATLKKTAGVKAEELGWTGILDWLDGVEGQVERDDVLTYVRENGVVVRTIYLGQPTPEEIREQADYLMGEWIEDALDRLGDYNEADREAVESGALGRWGTFELRARDNLMADVETQYSRYTLPGGEQYFEVLMTLPVNNVEVRQTARGEFPRFGVWVNGLTSGREYDTEERAQEAADGAVQMARGNYHSGHFSAPNIVAHFRIKTRLDVDGKKVLFVEEVQSDWHQAGRDKGYSRRGTPEEIAAAKELVASRRGEYKAAIIAADEAEAAMTAGLARRLTKVGDAWAAKGFEEADNFWKERGQAIHAGAPAVVNDWGLAGSTRTDGRAAIVPEWGAFEASRSAVDAADLRNREATQALQALEGEVGIPDAPFKKSWPALAMKRIIRHAVDTGHEAIAWTTGQQQIDRYDLAETLSEIGVKRIEGEPDVFLVRTGGAVGESIIAQGLAQATAIHDLLRMSAGQISEVFGSDLGGRMIARANEAPMIDSFVLDERGAPATQVPSEVTMRGLDLQIGGEGMKGFYDRNLVNITNDVIKKSGVRVEKVRIPSIPNVALEAEDRANADRIGAELEAEKARTADEEGRLKAELEQYLRDNGFTNYGTYYENAAGVRAQDDPGYQALNERWLALVAPQRQLHAEWVRSRKDSKAAAQPGFYINDALKEQARAGFTLFQRTPVDARGSITLSDNGALIRLFESANRSTFLHESGHLWLDELQKDAESPGAPEQLKRDWAMVVNWFAANGQPLQNGNVTTDAHEMWARGVELYLREGKAPSRELQGVFTQFAAWLVRIYRSVKDLNTPMTPEIREVMGRLLATDDQIEAAMKADEARRLFKDAATANMTKAQFDAYVKADEATRGDAFSALVAKMMKVIERRHTGEVDEDRDAITEVVAAEINNLPINRALAMIRRGRPYGDDEGPVTKVQINGPDLVARYGDEIVDQMPKGVPPVVSKTGGIDVDTFAEMTGFTTGDDLVQALVKNEADQRAMKDAGDTRTIRQREIEDRVEAELAARYGDPMTDGTLEEEAIAAIHNDQRATVIASELDALRRMAKRPSGEATTWQVAREWARQTVAAGKVSEQATLLAMRRHLQAERRAALAAEKAMLEGDVDEAFRQKNAQLFASAMYRAAKDAKDAAEKSTTRLEKLARKRTIRSMEQDYLDRIHEMLEFYDTSTASTRDREPGTSIAEWVLGRQAAGEDLFLPRAVVVGAPVKLENITVEALADLDEAVARIAHAGRRKKKIDVEGKSLEFALLRDQLVSQLDALYVEAGVTPSDNMEPTKIERAKSFIRGLDASLLKMETLLDWLDGGDPNGMFNRAVWRRIAAAQTKEQAMMADYSRRLDRLLRNVPKEQMKSWGKRVAVPMLINSETGDPWSLNKQHLISAALNTGNEGNLQRLLDGYGWELSDLEAAFDQHLTAEDWAFVQGVWDLIGGLWPEISAMERRLNGALPPKVEPRAFTNRHGSFEGGYYPAVYDPTKSIEAARTAEAAGDKLFENSYRKASTRASATKDRQAKVSRPLLLSLSVINRHMGEVIHDIAYREAIIDADRILSDKRVVAGVNAAMGPEYSKLFRPWLQSIANEFAIEGKDPAVLDKIFHHARTATTMVGLGFRVSTVVMQFLGFANTAEIIGAKWLSVGLAKTLANPVKAFELVTDMSGEMRSRFDNLDRDIRENIKAYAGQEDIASQVRRFAFYGIGYADRMVAIPTWVGAYNRALTEQMSERDAIQYADKAVRASQGAGASKDVSAIMRSSEAMRLFTVFYSYFNALYARQRTLGRDYARALQDGRVRDLPLLLARSWWLLMAPVLGQALMSGNGPDDDEDWGLWALQKLLVGNMGSLPIVRDIAGALDSGFGYKFSPVARAGETFVRSVTDIQKALSEDEEPSGKWLKNGLETSGYVFKLPTGQLAAASQFLLDVSNGDQDPDTIMDWYRGLTTGKAEPRRDQ